MFSLWALYVKKNNAHKVVEIDAQTEIAYEWHSPYFNEQPSASWDFSVPRTPYNEALLLNTTENGELYPLSEGYFDAYFRGLPWQADSEIDEGLLTVVKISTRRITLQFKQVCRVLERLMHKDTRGIVTISNNVSVSTPYNSRGGIGSLINPTYFLCFAETLRATGAAIVHDKPYLTQKAIVGIALPELLKLMLPNLKFADATGDTLKTCFIIPNAPNFIGKISLNTQTLYNPIVYKPNSIIRGIATNDDCGVTTETPAISPTVKLNGTLQLWGGLTARELLTELLSAFSLHLRVRTFLNADNTTRDECEIISPLRQDKDMGALGKLSTFKYYTFSIPRYPTESERTQNYTPEYEPYTPWPLMAVREEKSDTPHERWRYFNRQQLVQFHPPITDGAEYYTESKAEVSTLKYDWASNPVWWTKKMFQMQQVEDPWNYYADSWDIKRRPEQYSPLNEVKKEWGRIFAVIPRYIHISFYEKHPNCVNLDDDYYVLTKEGRWKYVGHKAETQPRIVPHVSYRDLKLCRGRVIFAQTHPQEDVVLCFDTIRAVSIMQNIKSNEEIYKVEQDYATGVITKEYKQDKLWYGLGLFEDPREEENSKSNAWRWLPAVYKTHDPRKATFKYHGTKRTTKQNHASGITLLNEHPAPVDVTLYDAHGDPITMPTTTRYKLINPGIEIPGAWEETLPHKWNNTRVVYSEATFKVQKSPCIHALDVPTPSDSSSETQFYLRTLTSHTIAKNDYLRCLLYGGEVAPVLTCNGQTVRESLTGVVNELIKKYTEAYYKKLATSIEGELETWDEAIVFAALFWYPYPSDSNTRIGVQRINHLSLTLRLNECRIRKVNVIQFNLPATL